jgi:hypothetical protein
MTQSEKEEVASRIARAVTDALNRTNEIPTEEELRQAVLYVLETVG